ncbi:MAG TPA: GNAT family N-acetyltransferase [Geminicoccaceae bacterium]|nr:GNAT family N-acetyltransferase [Geminicoccaceae bacterium]
MTKTAIFDPLTPAHLDGAVALSRAEGWPHRLEDWALILGLSRGIAALDGDRLVGTAMATPFGPAGALSMIVVARDWRGRGLARAMMERLMDGEARQWRLVATAEALPLYAKLGFVETHRIVQQQGTVAAVAAPEGVAWAEPGDTEAIAALDRAATGMDRAGLVAALAGAGRLAVIRDESGPAGYAALRPFGRGEVAGPVVARDAADARRLLAFLFASRPGAFLRVDTPEASGLGDWLAAQGLAPVGGGIAMIRGGAPAAASEFQSFALAAQALG